MALETQVGQLVTATTALQAAVSSELTKVRAANTTFQDSLSNSIANSFSFTNPKLTSPLIKATTASEGGEIDWEFGSGSKLAQSITTPVGRRPWLASDVCNSQYRIFAYGNSVLFGLVIDFYQNSVALGGGGIPGAGAAYPNNINFNYALGYASLSGNSSWSNTVGIGYNAQVSGANQVQIGDSNTSVYTYGAIQSRSDRRDKTDIRPTTLGLDFVKALRPVDYRWDIRDAYKKLMPEAINSDASDAEKAAYDIAISEWRESNKLENLNLDGSKKRSRIHHGLIAQEVEELIRSTGKDFGGFQNHKRSGGDDVLSIAYPELIAPLIKAVQELAQMNEELRARISTLESVIA